MPQSLWPLRIFRVAEIEENFIRLIKKCVGSTGGGTWALGTEESASLARPHLPLGLPAPSRPPSPAPAEAGPPKGTGLQSFAGSPFVPLSLEPLEPNVACEQQAWLLLG